jgi:hypothetical protein
MADIVTDLAGKSGLSPELVRKGLGAILEVFKDKLPADTFAKISSAVPGAEGLMATAKSSAETSGGVLSAVTGAVGKLFGGSAAEMASKLTHLGFSAEQLQAFLPKVLEILRSRLPADVVSKIGGLLPAAKEPVG